MWCDDWINSCRCEFKLDCFVCFFRAPGLVSFCWFNGDANPNCCPICTKTMCSWKIHQNQIQNSTQKKKKVLIDVLPAGLFHIEMNFIDMNRGFTQSLLTDLLGLYWEVKVWLSKTLLVLPDCTSYPSCRVPLSLVINTHFLSYRFLITAIVEPLLNGPLISGLARQIGYRRHLCFVSRNVTHSEMKPALWVYNSPTCLVELHNGWRCILNE